MSAHRPPHEHALPSVPARRRTSRTKLFGALVAGHGAFVLVKLLGIAGLVALLGGLEMRFGLEVAGIALLHVAAIAVLVLALRHWLRRRHRTGA